MDFKKQQEMMATDINLTIGILAIQGAVQEHIDCVKKLGCDTKSIRSPKDMDDIDGIILPGGESTAMAIVGEANGLFPALKSWVNAKKPIWGTCAGMILLSDYAIKQANGGQSLVGGLDVQVCRNYFGSQIYSCEVEITIDSTLFQACNINSPQHGNGINNSNDAKNNNIDNQLNPYQAIFIRAPAILKVGPEVIVLASIDATPHISAIEEVQKLLLPLANDNNSNNDHDNNNDNNKSEIIEQKSKRVKIGNDNEYENKSNKFKVIVAVQQGQILATAFHPELTQDLRWHE
eukprot:gene15466-20867_t